MQKYAKYPKQKFAICKKYEKYAKICQNMLNMPKMCKKMHNMQKQICKNNMQNNMHKICNK